MPPYLEVFCSFMIHHPTATQDSLDEIHNLRSLQNNIVMIKLVKDDMSGACGTHGGEEKCIQILVANPIVKGHHLKDPGIYEMIILK
jgi:hypothetical protein